MKNYINIFLVLGLLLSQELVAGDDQKITADDSSTDLSGQELLDNITPNQHHEGGFSGYEFLEGKITAINYSIVSPILGGSNTISGDFIAAVDGNGKLRLILVAQTNIDINNPDRIGGYKLGLTNESFGGGANPGGADVIIMPGYYAVYGDQGFSSETLSIGEMLKGRVTPAGLNLEITDKHSGVFYNAFCPWSKDANYPNAKCVIAPTGNKVYHMTTNNVSSIEVTP